ncbi:MAG TPA: hypothetical protein PKE00_07125 [Planctomycetota bacterium]|nr:hypothetical protein [Planctomycetota bacterium]
MIVSLVCLPMLLGVVSTTQRVAETLTTNDKTSMNSETIEVVVGRMTSQLRAAHRASFATKALPIDVTELRATTVGEWIPAVEATARKNLRFTSAAGTMSMNAVEATETREYDFVLDPGEVENGSDDDGDGLVDEGTLVLRRAGGPPLAVLRGVEAFSYEVDGRAIRLVVRAARRDARGRVYRASAAPMIFVRNS